MDTFDIRYGNRRFFNKIFGKRKLDNRLSEEIKNELALSTTRQISTMNFQNLIY